MADKPIQIVRSVMEYFVVTFLRWYQMARYLAPERSSAAEITI
jgi:hypothetical protein